MLIERGVESGFQIKFPREGDQDPGKIPSDLIVILDVRKHDLYQRDGSNLIGRTVKPW